MIMMLFIIISDALALPLPFESEWSDYKLSYVTLMYLQQFVIYLDIHSQQWDELSESSLTSLIPYTRVLLYHRYLEDFVSNLLPDQGDYFIQQRKYQKEKALQTKIKRYASKAASHLVTKIFQQLQLEYMTKRTIEEEVKVQEETENIKIDILSFEDHYQRHNRWGTLIAIVALKACDYLEEVAMYVAYMILEKTEDDEGEIKPKISRKVCDDSNSFEYYC
jgi:hypothetical protein